MKSQKEIDDYDRSMEPYANNPVDSLDSQCFLHKRIDLSLLIYRKRIDGGNM